MSCSKCSVITYDSLLQASSVARNRVAAWERDGRIFETSAVRENVRRGKSTVGE
jgi:hypothetical protein